MCARPRSFTNEELVAAMRNHPRPFCTAKELAEQFDVGNTTILGRLEELEDEGAVGSKNVGARAVVFWLHSDEDTASCPSSLNQ